MANRISIKEFLKEMRPEAAEKLQVVYETTRSGRAKAPVEAYIMADGSLVMLLAGGKLMTQ